MKKRIIASTLVAILCITLLPYHVFANKQSPVSGISDIAVIGHTKTSGAIRPVVELKFEEPRKSEEEDGSAAGEDKSKLHEVTHYQVHINEYLESSASIKAPTDPSILPVEKIGPDNTIPVQTHTDKLQNGTLYKMQIVPYHRHEYKNQEGLANDKRWAPHTIPINQHPFKYVLTDFDTRVEGQAGSLEVTWEDSGYADMNYQIGYIQGNYEGKTIDEIKSEATAGNNIQYISSEDIKKNAEEGDRDPQTNRKRFKYTIDKNIATGQMYSVFVITTTETIGGSTNKILKNEISPKVVTATTEIELDVFNIGQDKIRLKWSAQFPDLMDGAYKLVQTQIKEYSPGDESGQVISTLYGKEGAGIGYYEYKEPKESTYYQLVFIYEHEISHEQLTPPPKTEKVLYVPGELRTKPATPEIPKPIGPGTTVTPSNKGEFLLPNDALDIPDKDLQKSDHTFHANMVKPYSLNLVWSASKDDLPLLYDIVVTDDLEVAQSDVEPIVKDLTFSSGQNPEGVLYNQDKDEVVGFRHTLREYYNGDMNKQPLVPNKVYYVKVVAKRQYGEEFELSLPVIVTIMFDSDGDMFSPPMISKPPLRLDPDGTGKTSVTIGWLESWYEILALDPTIFHKDEQEKAKQWNAKVYTTTGSAISFMNKKGSKEHILKRSQDLGVVKSIVGQQKYKDNFIDRIVNLGKDVKYDYKMIPYEEILQGLKSYNESTNNKKTVEEYIETLMKNETDPEKDYGWKKITPDQVRDEDGIDWKHHTQNNLKPNTSYVFFVKPYTNDHDGTKLQAALPTWLVVTTLPDGEIAEGKPTVPVLSLNGKGDSHISVEWEYNDAFDYEIRYSRLQNPDQATIWPFEIGTEIDDPGYVENGGKAVVKIDGLFPDTNYHVWIRAKQKKGQGVSAWSNPVSTKTDLLGSPSSPAGLGTASYQSILEVGRDFTPVGEKYVTIEWQRNGGDRDLDDITQDGQRVQKDYRYVIEIADNPEFLDPKNITASKETVGSQVDNGEVLSRSMVYFDNLIANRPYYIRGKTILVAHDQENNREIVMESDYTDFIRIITQPSEDEYDGGDKTNEVIYPEKIEETYDETTWTYEIVDTQKVISEMVTQNEFKYVVAVEKFRGYYDAKYRVIKIPQPVIQALVNRGMALEIRSNILTLEIPAKALKASMINTSAEDMVELTFQTLNESDLFGIDMGYQYKLLSTPEKIEITLNGHKGIRPINKVDALMKVKINMPHQLDYMYKNLGGYAYNPVNSTWKKSNHTFDKVNMQLGYTTGTLGIYAAYELGNQTGSNPGMSQSMQQLSLSHDILGLGTKYTQNTKVETPEYINMMLGIAENRKEIIPDMGPTLAEEERARRAGLYLANPKTALTQEAAISGIVKLYELTSGMAIRPQTNASLGHVTGGYRNNIRKAYTIGLIDSINPGQSITYGELFDLIEQVVE